MKVKMIVAQNVNYRSNICIFELLKAADPWFLSYQEEHSFTFGFKLRVYVDV